MSSRSADVLIVGAGLAGLSAAIHCQSAGVDVKVIESSDRAGGRVASDVIDGFIQAGRLRISNGFGSDQHQFCLINQRNIEYHFVFKSSQGFSCSAGAEP